MLIIHEHNHIGDEEMATTNLNIRTDKEIKEAAEKSTPV